MHEPNEPHDEWGRPIEPVEPEQTMLDRVRDIFFFSCVGIIFLVIFGWILLVFMPYYLGREIWHRFENWYINK